MVIMLGEAAVLRRATNCTTGTRHAHVFLPQWCAGRWGRPHPRLVWLDVSRPECPVLMWQAGEVKGAGGVKATSRVGLAEVVDMKAGLASNVLRRSGRREDADRYLVFDWYTRTLDLEVPSEARRDWLCIKFQDLFKAYAAA